MEGKQAERLDPERERSMVERFEKRGVRVEWRAESGEWPGGYIGEFQINPQHEGPQRNISAPPAQEMVTMTPSMIEPVAAIHGAAAALHEASRGFDPFVYTACVRAALSAVAESMRFVGSYIFAWNEENQTTDAHLHSISGARVMCVCDECLKRHDTVMQEIASYASLEVGRYRNHLQGIRAHEDGEVGQAPAAPSRSLQ